MEAAGLKSLRSEHILRDCVVTLNDFLQPEAPRDWSEPKFGLSIIDVLRHVYKTDQRFAVRDKKPAILVKGEPRNGLVEAVFGAYPRQQDTKYFEQGFKDVFAPTELASGPDAWLQAFSEGADTPLKVTRHALEFERHWYDGAVIYVFDPSQATDLIDLWNLRLEPNPVLPVPMDWVDSLSSHLCRFIKHEHRPVRGNPSGLMHHATIEFGRSIAKGQAESIAAALHTKVPAGSLAAKYWRNRIWEEPGDDRISRERRLRVNAGEKQVAASIKEGDAPRVSLESLAPTFASRYGGHDARWVNAISLRPVNTERYATILPFNTWNRAWPRLDFAGDQVSVNSEGWVFHETYKDWTNSVALMTREEAIVGSLKQYGIDAELSEPGHIAKQMLEHLGGLWSLHLIADLETLKLLNKMAGGVRKLSDEAGTTEETFERRSKLVKDWFDLIERRRKRNPLPRVHLSDFTDRNVIRLGVESKCPHCQTDNWHSLSALDYSVTCDRCLNAYAFPQARLKESNRNWHYRVVGPFSVPDYGRGSYSALLVLRFINRAMGMQREMTFSTAMNLRFGDFKGEVDFVAWKSSREMRGPQDEPELIIGEAKSLGQGDLLKPKDISKLKAIAKKLPGAVIIVSVLRDKFTRGEVALLRSFANWGSRVDERGRPMNPIIVMTAMELFFHHLISATWKEMGGPYAAFATYENTRNFYSLANATQQIYLGLPSFEARREAYWKRRHEAKRRRQKRST